MRSPRYARLLAEIIKRETSGEPESGPSSYRSEDIALVERAMNHRIWRRRCRRWGLGAGTALLVALASAGIWKIRGADRALSKLPEAPRAVVEPAAPPPPPTVIAYASQGASLAVTGAASPVENGRRLTPGSRLVVDHGAGATLSLSTGTHLDVDPGSEMMVIEEGRAQVFALNKGALRADVAKLSQGDRFMVRTPDAEIEVRGTSFQVGVVPPDPRCGHGTTTRVNVYEGVVVVRKDGREESVHKGEAWPGQCSSPAPSLGVPGTVTPKRASRSEARPSPRMASQSSSSTLTEENDIFAEAMLARRTGSISSALAAIDRFLDRYPHSHLAENAAAERMRMLRQVDAARALAAARLYLARYPTGFARTEAETIIAEMP